MHRPGLAGAAEQGPPPLPVLLCKKTFVRRAGQPWVANSGFNLPGIHHDKEAEPARELRAQQGLTCCTAWSGEHHGVPLSSCLQQPVESFIKHGSTTACGWSPWDGPLQFQAAQGFCRKQGVKPASPAKPFPTLRGLGRKSSGGLKQAGEVKAIFSFLQGSRVSKLPSLLCEPPEPHK